MKYYQVTKEGKYIKPANDKIGYAGLLLKRADILHQCYFALAYALTIGVRYSIVRK